MKVKKLKIRGAFLVDLTKNKDQRGFFSRLFCKKNFSKILKNNKIAQINFCNTYIKGCVRGLHYQSGGFSETKRIIILKGKIFDVIVDIRKNSKTYNMIENIKLSDKKLQMLIVPKGVAHGYQSLSNETCVMYINDNYYNKKYEKGINYKDPKYNISWPLKIKMISKKDKKIKYL